MNVRHINKLKKKGVQERWILEILFLINFILNFPFLIRSHADGDLLDIIESL